MFFITNIAGVSILIYYLIEIGKEIKRELRRYVMYRKNMFVSIVLMVSLMISSMIFIAPNNITYDNISILNSQTTNIAVYEAETAYALNEQFSNSDISDWEIWKGHSSTTVAVLNGELELKNADWASFLVNHTLDVSKQDYIISYNLRIDEDTAPQNNPVLLQLLSESFYGEETYGSMGVVCKWASNRTVSTTYDTGTKTEPPNLITSYSPVLGSNINYQLTWQFWGINDTCKFRIYNESSSTYLYSKVVITFETNVLGIIVRPLPDKLQIGATGYATTVAAHWYIDDITITYDQATHDGITPNYGLISNVIDSFMSQVSNAWFDGKIRQGYVLNDPDWETEPSYYHENSTYNTCRDDTLGEMIRMCVKYYQYTGNIHYLNVAESYWEALLTHRQSDGGFIFATVNTDYSLTDSIIIMALLELYTATLDETYLNHAIVTLEFLKGYTNVGTGMAYGRIDRPSTYTELYNTFHIANSAIAFAEGYALTGDSTYLNYMNLNIGFIIRATSYQGRVVSPSFGTSTYGQDYSDSSRTGMCLWALCRAYKITGNLDYLNHSTLMANYLVRSEFTKNDESFGLWTGVIKSRINQVDILYNYGILYGLWEYLTISFDQTIYESFVASINKMALIFGTNDNVQSYTLYGYQNVWGASWNINDTDNQGLTKGYWGEGGWGTWGLVAFYNWQGCTVYPFMSIMKNPDLNVPHINSGVVFREDGTIWQSTMPSTNDPVYMDVTSSEDKTVLVNRYERNNINTMIFEIKSETEAPATITLTNLLQIVLYQVFKDDVLVAEGTASGTSQVFSFVVIEDGIYEINQITNPYAAPFSILMVALIIIGITATIIIIVLKKKDTGKIF
jgi:hypothetical protein